MKLTILLISILLIGCTKPIEIECKNITINNTITIFNETIQYVNQTCNTTQEYTYTGTTSRELELIRRIGFLEGQQDKWIINETECMPHNITEEKLQNC